MLHARLRIQITLAKQANWTSYIRSPEAPTIFFPSFIFLRDVCTTPNERAYREGYDEAASFSIGKWELIAGCNWGNVHKALDKAQQDQRCCSVVYYSDDFPVCFLRKELRKKSKCTLAVETHWNTRAIPSQIDGWSACFMLILCNNLILRHTRASHF